MLNPSTADETVDDPTVRRVRAFSRSAGYDAFTVANLTPVRATDPKRIDPALVEDHHHANVDLLRNLTSTAELVVCAWGAYRGLNRIHQTAGLVSLWPHLDGKRRCLGMTKGSDR